MNTILAIISSQTTDVLQATRLLRKNRVSNQKLKRMSKGNCIFSHSSPVLREASKIALVQNIEATQRKAKKTVETLQSKLAYDGGLLLPTG